MRYTIEDVAKEANVSISTVSRVLNNNYPVKKETRQRIEEAIKKLDYKPNPLARGLVSGKSNIIGVLVPNLKSLIYTEMISFIEYRLSQNGYDVMITTTNSKKEEEEEAIKRFLNRSVDGIIIIETELLRDDEFLKDVMEKTPILFVNKHDEKTNNVYVDNKEAVKNVLDYVLNLGHTKVAMAYEKGNKVHEECLKHYRELASEQEIYPVTVGIDSEDLDDEDLDVLEKHMDSYEIGKDITAFIACDYLVMLRVFRGIYKRGLSIPKDVSIINLKNTDLSKMLHPKISSIDISPDKIAEAVTNKIMHLLKNKEFKIVGEKIYTGIIERESCRSIIRKPKKEIEDYFL